MGTFQTLLGYRWGISSNGRAPASHAGGTGIDTRILQIKLFWGSDQGCVALSSFSATSWITLFLNVKKRGSNSLPWRYQHHALPTELTDQLHLMN